MRNPLKHKPEVKVKKTKAKEKQDYLLAESVRSSGVIDIQNDMIQTQENKLYGVFECSYIEANGLDYSMDERNENRMNELIKTLQGDIKIQFVSQKKNNLDENISFFEKRVKEESNEGLKERMLERIEVMKFHNRIRYTTMYFYISEDLMLNFEKFAPSFLKIKRIKGDQLQNLMMELNNNVG